MSSSEPSEAIDPRNATISTAINPADRAVAEDILSTDVSSLWLNQGFQWLVRGASLLTVFILLWMGWVIYEKAVPAIQKFGWQFLTSQEWDVPGLIFGALPYI
jgi:phosphate transport system permease protein